MMGQQRLRCTAYPWLILRDCLVFRKSIVLLLAPLLLLPLPLCISNSNVDIHTVTKGAIILFVVALGQQLYARLPVRRTCTLIYGFACLIYSLAEIAKLYVQAKCAYVVLLMAVYWVTEALPLAVTSFIPMVLFPALGIATAYQTSTNYLKDTNFILVGGLIMAVAVEDSNLHKRIALKLLLWVGSEPKNLMFGFMLSTAMLSAFMSNTATASMMLPIAVAVLEEVIKNELESVEVAGVTTSTTIPIEKQNGINPEKISLVGTPKSKIKFELSNRRRSVLESTIDPDAAECVEVGYDSGQPIVRMGFRPVPSSTYLLGVDYHRHADVGTQSDETDLIRIPQPIEPLPSQGRIRARTLSATEEYRSKIPHFHTLPARLQSVSKAVLLCIAYGANLGGTATLTGTGPNLVFIGQLLKFYPNETAITYVTWLAFGVPTMICCCFIGWCWLVILFLGWKNLLPRLLRKSNGNAAVGSNVNAILHKKYAELGSISFAEASVASWFFLLVFLWIFREPMFIDGWNDWLGLKPGFTSDACAAMLVACALFAWPREMPDFICWRKNPEERPKSRRSLMSWTTMRKFPWGLVLLLGGGFAMADGVRRSGLSDWLGCTLRDTFRHLPLMLILLIFLVLIALCTEIASNAATASIFVPVVLSVAESLEVNPLYFGLAVTAATSFVFILPVGTPPNAIVYESRMIRALDMLKAGLVMNVLCTCINLLNINTWSYWFFALDVYPTWAHSANATGPAC